ncbi:MAG: hypothetical protein KGI27_15385, partial [Thaumarchaeota archaeon]|nr:hypothetical protein [Nitrososphaerota archaeon]
MMKAISGSKKTSTITFRLDDDAIHRLRDLSKVQEVSTNTLVNRALKRFIDWDVYLPRSGFVILSKPVLKKLFDGLDEKSVVEIASTIGKEGIEDIALFMRGKVELTSFISWYETLMINSSVQVSHLVDNGFHNMVLKHDLGRKWSLYQKTILELIFKELFQKKI